MFELQDLIPYVFSISFLASFAYAAYFFRQHKEEGMRWLADASCLPLQQVRPPAVSLRVPLGLKLVRSVKRKESPDADSADCHSLSMSHEAYSSDREAINNYAYEKNKPLAKQPKLYFALLGLLLLAGCGSKTGTIDSNTPGFFNHYVIYPLSYLIQHIAAFFGDSYGIAVIVMTLLIRLALLPFMLRQYRGQQLMKQKMAAMKPELDKLNEKYKDKKDRDSAAKNSRK